MKSQVATVALALAWLAVPAAAQPVRQVNLTNNDIVWDRVTSRLYISVPSSVGSPRGNSLTQIDPTNGTLGVSTFIGSEPRRLAIAREGGVIYAGLDGAAAVRRLDTPTLTPGTQFSLGSDSSLGPFYAEDIAVMPGNNGTVAVSRRNQGFSPRHAGVAIYDNGVARPATTPDHTGSNVIEFGNNSTRLYGYNNESTEFGFRTMAVGSTGVSTTNVAANLMGGFGVDFIFGGNRVFSTTGRVIDPVSRTLLGTISAGGPVAFEESSNRVFFAVTGQVRVFDASTFLLVGTIPVAGLSGPEGVVRWGGDGLAIRTSASVFIVNSTLVPTPGTAVVLGLGLLTLRRRRSER